MRIDTACQALHRNKVLQLQYDGYFRTVEVHAAGYSKEGDPLMRVWQTGGGSVSNEPIGWKLLRLDEAAGAHLTDSAAITPRPGYKPGDRAMARIVCQL